MQTIREAKIEAASRFLEEHTVKVVRGREAFIKTGKFDHELSAWLILSPITIVDLLENEEILHAEYCHEASLENAYKR